MIFIGLLVKIGNPLPVVNFPMAAGGLDLFLQTTRHPRRIRQIRTKTDTHPKGTT